MIIDRTPVNVCVAVLVALVCLIFDTRLAWHFAHNVTSPLFGDFFGMWSYARCITEGHARALYDAGFVHAVQRRLEPGFRGELPFFYPPPMMFLLAPLGLLTQVQAYIVWQLGGLAAFAAAAFWRAPRPLVAAAMLLVLPGTTLALFWGNTGFVTGALLLGGLRLARARPVLGGFLLGLLIVKPQCILLLPVALMAARTWRAIGAATMSAAIMVCATGAVFGFETWLDWMHALPSAEAQWHVAALGPENLRKHAQFATTVTASLALLHLSWSLIRALQLLAAIFGAAIVWIAARRGLDGNAVAALTAATFLATPHGFLYDMPALLGAVMLLLTEPQVDRMALVAMVLLLILPVMATLHVLPFAGPPLMAFLAVGFARRSLVSSPMPMRRPVLASHPDVSPHALSAY